VNCREFVDFLMAYLDGELEPTQAEVFRRHMRACPACVDYLDTYRQTIELGRGICETPDAAVPDDVPEALVRAILAARAAGGRS
jgi:anti-sigma factor (TIGR02949 family)